MLDLALGLAHLHKAWQFAGTCKRTIGSRRAFSVGLGGFWLACIDSVISCQTSSYLATGCKVACYRNADVGACATPMHV